MTNVRSVSKLTVHHTPSPAKARITPCAWLTRGPNPKSHRVTNYNSNPTLYNATLRYATLYHYAHYLYHTTLRCITTHTLHCTALLHPHSYVPYMSIFRTGVYLPPSSLNAVLVCMYVPGTIYVGIYNTLDLEATTTNLSKLLYVCRRHATYI